MTRQSETAIRKRRMRKLKGVIKWDNGMPTLRYARAGYGWVKGDYVKLTPRATGIVQTFGASRADEREAAHYDAHPEPREHGSDKPRSQRSRSKQAARERFERLKAQSLERVRAEKERKRIERSHRQTRIAAARA